MLSLFPGLPLTAATFCCPQKSLLHPGPGILQDCVHFLSRETLNPQIGTESLPLSDRTLD